MIYTRENSDPNPMEPVYDPEKILCNNREKALDPFYFLDRIISLPKDNVERIVDLEFDELFGETLFRSKSKTNLDEIVFYHKIFQ
jgi:hypothetical protein